MAVVDSTNANELVVDAKVALTNVAFLATDAPPLGVDVTMVVAQKVLVPLLETVVVVLALEV